MFFIFFGSSTWNPRYVVSIAVKFIYIWQVEINNRWKTTDFFLKYETHENKLRGTHALLVGLGENDCADYLTDVYLPVSEILMRFETIEVNYRPFFFFFLNTLSILKHLASICVRHSSYFDLFVIRFEKFFFDIFLDPGPVLCINFGFRHLSAYRSILILTLFMFLKKMVLGFETLSVTTLKIKNRVFIIFFCNWWGNLLFLSSERINLYHALKVKNSAFQFLIFNEL